MNQPVPVVDGEAGPCSVEFTVTNGAGRRIYGAQITVHIEYGFLGLQRLDLEVGTNVAGLARFEGLPESTDGVLFFRAKKGSLRGYAFYYPNHQCQAKHAIIMTRSRVVGSTVSALAPRTFMRHRGRTGGP